MHRSSSHKLLREEFTSCFSPVVRLSYNKCRSSYSIGVLVGDCCHWRTCSTHNLLGPGSEKLSSNLQAFSDPSRSFLSRSGDSPKFVSGETHSILQSSSLQIRNLFFKSEICFSNPTFVKGYILGIILTFMHQRSQIFQANETVINSPHTSFFLILCFISNGDSVIYPCFVPWTYVLLFSKNCVSGYTGI